MVFSQKILSALIQLLVLVTTAIALFVFYKIWILHFQAAAGPNAPTGSETRLMLAVTAAAGISLAAALLNWIDRSRSLELERQKKAIELKTDAAFEMWKSVSQAYRILQKAETEDFQQKDIQKLNNSFSESERRGLLFDDSLLEEFQFFWHETERISQEIIESNGIPSSQYAVWSRNIKEYSTKYIKIKSLIKNQIN